MTILISIQTFSQNKDIDSLRRLISQTKNDTIKVNALNALGQKLLRYDLDRALDTIELAYKISKSKKFYKGEAKSLKEKAFVYFYKGKIDSALNLFIKGKDIYEANGYKADAGRMYNNIGIVQSRMGNLRESLKSYLKAISLLKQTGDIEALIATYINASDSYRNVGNYEEALQLSFKAMQQFDNLKVKTFRDSIKEAHIFKGIANIYVSQRKIKSAENYYMKAMSIYKKYGANTDLADIYLNLGYLHINEPQKAKRNYLKALKLYKKTNKIALAYLNLGEVYMRENEIDSAKYFLENSLKLYKEIDDKRGITQVLSSISDIYYKQKELQKALKYSSEAFKIAQKIGDIQIINTVSAQMYEIYKALGKYKEALAMHELYKKTQDSIFNTNNEQKLTQIALTYEFDKQRAQEELKYKEELKRQKIVKNFSIAISFFVLMAFIALFSAFRTKKRKNKELEKKNAEIMQQKEEIIAQRDEIETQVEEISKQKMKIELQSKEIEKQRDLAVIRGNELEQKNRDIEASIHYALRIQQALMPSLEILRETFSDYFLFYKPRDIVSGDFYWASKKGDATVVVAADCTGHGVPGAFMSMLGVSFLNQIVREKGILDANKILDELKIKIISSLRQNIDDANSSRDGMDMSLIVYHSNDNKLDYAGAYNPIYIVSEKTPEFIDVKEKFRIYETEDKKEKLLEIMADRMPIGIHLLKEGNFSRQIVRLAKGDKIYMFSDGFADLFNKKMQKKYSTKRFKKLLLSISDLSMTEQEKRIAQEFENWLEGEKQIDDVLIIGMKI